MEKKKEKEILQEEEEEEEEEASEGDEDSGMYSEAEGEEEEEAEVEAEEEVQEEAKEKGGKHSTKDKKKAETLALCRELGLDLSGTLQEKIASYCRVMLAQPIETLKQVHLPAIFSPQEMTSMWQMLRGWIKKASSKTQAKWAEICKLQGSHTAPGGKNEANNSILNLALVRSMDWEEQICKLSVGLEDVEEEGKHSKWLYKSELQRKVGKATTARWIKTNKLEVDYDSDGEQIFRKKQRIHNESTVLRSDQTTKQKRSSTKNNKHNQQQ